MKKHLGLITAIGLVATTGSTVIACNKRQNDSPSKIALKKLIDQVTPIVEENKNSRHDSAFSNLNIKLIEAKECHFSSDSTNNDYLKASINLVEALKEFNNPGYKAEKERLVKLLEEVNDYVTKNSDLKTPKVIANLKQAIKETWEVLDNELNPIMIKLNRLNLDSHFDKYKKDKGEENNF